MSRPEPSAFTDPRDAAAFAALHALSAATFEVVGLWPITGDHPALTRLGKLVDTHGLFTVLSVALGWAAHEVRVLLGVNGTKRVRPGSFTLYYPSRPASKELAGVVAKLLEHVLDDADGVPRLYDAAAMLRQDGGESGRTLAAVLDLCAALRDDRCIVERTPAVRS